MADKQEKIKAQREREDLATLRDRERQDLLSSLAYPKRGSKELSLVRKAAESLLPLLKLYDMAAAPPEIEDPTQELFTRFVERLDELCTILAPKPE